MSAKKQRILIADDERINRKVLSELLEEQHEVVLAKSGNQVLERIQENESIDLIVLDILMPDMDGYETLRKIKEIENGKDIPVIFITSLDSVQDEEKGLKLGASDYITKPFHPGIVRLRVENHLKFVRKRKLLETLVGHDGLTEINNRRTFDEKLITEWDRRKRNNQPLSVVMIDVDYFKKYNDYYGHAAGDKVLKSVASTISSEILRPGDIVARYGGEEFALILPDTKKEGAIHVAEKIRGAIENLCIEHIKSENATCVTISMGGATSTTIDRSSEEFLKVADEMLYSAKEGGRNRVVWRK